MDTLQTTGLPEEEPDMLAGVKNDAVGLFISLAVLGYGMLSDCGTENHQGDLHAQ